MPFAPFLVLKTGMSNCCICQLLNASNYSKKVCSTMRPSRRLMALFLTMTFLLGIIGLAHADPVRLQGNVLPFIQSGIAQPIAGANVASDTALTLAIGLNMRDRTGLDVYIQQLHDRSSPYFHQWLTPEQIADQFGPSQADYEAVVSWLQGQKGVTVSQTFNHRLVVMASTTTGVASSVFGVNFANFNYDGQNFTAATDDPFVPPEISGIVASVTGLNTYHGMKSNSAQGAPAGEVGPNTLSPPYTPSNIQTAYKMPVKDGFTGAANGVNMGILTACEAATTDLNGFASTYGLTAYTLNSNYFKVAINAKGDGSDPATDQEATLDAEWSHAMAPGATLYFYYDNYVDGCGVGAGWYFAGTIAGLSKMLSDNLVQTWSTSWGCSETDCWDTADENTVNGILASMVTAGMTGFVASGDNGAYANRDKSTLDVQFPQSDPYVISVGGTTLVINNDGSIASESGLWNGDWGSAGWGGGGGNSVKFTKPSFQSSPGATGVTGSGRGGPDVAMEMDFHYPIYYGGGISTGWGGTSFGAPEWNGYMASFIDYALTASGPFAPDPAHYYGRWGQLDTVIYYIAQHTGTDGTFPFKQGHRDTTSGANGYTSTCGGTGQPECGYSGVAGWDYATGWGSQVGNVLAYAMADYPLPMFTHAIAGSSNGYVNTFDAGYMPLSGAKAYYNANGVINAVAMSAPSSAGWSEEGVVTAASGGSNGYVNIYTGSMPWGGLSPSKYYNTNAAVLSIAVSSDGSTIAAGSSNGYLNVFIWTGSAWVVRYYNTNGAVNAVAVSRGPDNVILAGSANGYVNKFHRSGTNLIRDWYRNTNAAVLSVTVSNDAPYVGGAAAGSSNGYVNYWNNAALTGSSGTPTWYRNTNGAVNAISISASGYTMAAGSENGYVNHWGFPLTSATPDWYRNTNAAVKTVAEDPYSRFTAAGSSNGYVNFFAGSSNPLWYYKVNGVVKSVAFSGRGLPTGSSQLRIQGFTLFVGSSNGYVNAFFVYKGTPIWYYNTNGAANSVDAAGV
jgi:subtilase family serine protease